MSISLPAPTGLMTNYFGNSGGTTAYYYWIQAIYPDGRSAFVAFPTVTALAALDSNDIIQLKWNPVAGAIGFDIVRTSSSSAPSGTATIGVAVGISGSDTGYKDKGLALFSYTCILPTVALAATGYKATAHAQYVFGTDGGAVGAIVPANSDTIPAHAVITGGAAIATTALTSSGGATVALGVSAGGSATDLLTAAHGAVANFAQNTVVLLQDVIATPFRMSASGQIQLTVGTAALTAGVMDIWVDYYVASA